MRTLPFEKRFVSPSLAVISHSPEMTTKRLRVAVQCQSLCQSAGAEKKAILEAVKKDERLTNGAGGAKSTAFQLFRNVCEMRFPGFVCVESDVSRNHVVNAKCSLVVGGPPYKFTKYDALPQPELDEEIQIFP